MKRLSVILLSVIMVLSMCACVVDDAPAKEKKTESKSSSSKVKVKNETYSLDDTAVFQDIKVTATDAKISKGNEIFVPEEGKVFVGVKFTIENISDEEQSVSSILLFDAYCDDVKCSYSISANCAFDEGTIDGTISPGKKMTGYYAVEIPENWKNLELQVKSSWISSSKASFVFKSK